MIDFRALQRAVYDNKVAHGFNVTNMEKEFCLLQTEISEAYCAYGHEDMEGFAEELADVAIYLMGMAEIAGVDLENALVKKIEKNRTRRYKMNDHGWMEKEE